MARKKICQEPVKRTGGAATPCTPCAVVEDWCYRLEDDPAGTTRPGKHTYDLDAQCVRSNEKYIGDDGAEIELCTVTTVMCGQGNPAPPEPPEPPTPITLEGQDCAGSPLDAEGLPGQITQIVQAPGQVLTVRICEDNTDFELACGFDPATSHEVQIAYRIESGAMVVYKRWDAVTGLEWTGDPTTLESCGGTKLESDLVPMCDQGTEFIRWHVNKDGKPTNGT